MKEKKPLVSIVTVSYNSAKTIKDTIESIHNQSYENIEYIIIDGLSTDNTVEIVKEYESKYLKKGYKFKIVSEKDTGLYDAMNKGINMAKGEIIGILNSDDYYTNNLVIENVVNKMIAENADCLYADLLFVDEIDTNKIVRIWDSGGGDFRFGWNPPHPTTFIKKDMYVKYGLYKDTYKISSDYDILYRIIHKGKARTVYLQEYIVKMRSGGESTRGIKSNLVSIKEIFQILKEHDQKNKILIIFMRLIIKLKQFKLNR